MTTGQWKTGRENAGLTQVEAARSLGVTQPYLSQLETGVRVAGAALARKAAKFYKLPASALPLPESLEPLEVSPDDLQRNLAALGYPGFEHVRSKVRVNPAEVVFAAVVQRDLDTRLAEALPWVLIAYPDLNWKWLRDRVKLHNAQNRLGYVVYLAEHALREPQRAAVLSKWKNELEQARLAQEGTLCRDSMPEQERTWLRTHRPEAAAHWNLLTSLTADQLSYAAH